MYYSNLRGLLTIYVCVVSANEIRAQLPNIPLGKSVYPVQVLEKAKEAFDKAKRTLKDEINSSSERFAKLERDLGNLALPNVSEELWGEAGRVAYVRAANVMAARSPQGDSLDPWLKARLHLEFGDLVHKVNIHWGVSPLDEWVASIVKIRLSSTETQGQTYGYNIYIKDRKVDLKQSQIISLIGHELVHSRQFERFGNSYSNFGYHYFKEFKKGNMDYENNSLEREAYSIQDALKKQAYTTIVCKNGGQLLDANLETVSLPTCEVKSYPDQGADRANQRWYLEELSDGYFRIRNAMSGLALDADASQLETNGGRIQLYTPIAGNLNQQWHLTMVAPGEYIIKCRAKGRVLDADADKLNTPGCRVKLWDSNGGTHQVWKLTK